MRPLEIALSADRGEDQRFFDELLSSFKSTKINVRHESPLELLLRDTLSWYNVGKAPDALIAIYSRPFDDLKIIADLKKRVDYQWVPVYLLVNEDISLTKSRFLAFGVNDVVRWTGDRSAIQNQVYKWMQAVYSDLLLSQAG